MIRIGNMNFRTVQESVEWLMKQYQFLTNETNFVNITRMGLVADASELPDPTITEIPYLVGTQVPYELFLVSIDASGNYQWTDAGQFPREGSQGEQGVIGLTPQHRWLGTALQFIQQDGTWGTLVDLRGARGLFASIGLTDPTYVGENQEVYLNVQTGNVFRFNGSIWQNFGSLMGQNGTNGLTPFIGTNNNWWIGDNDTGILAVGTDGVDGQSLQIMSPVLNSASLLPAFASTSELEAYVVDDPSADFPYLYMHLVGGTDWDIIQWGQAGKDGADGSNGLQGIRGNSIFAIQGSTIPPTAIVNDLIINTAPSAVQIGSVIVPVGGVALITVATPYTVVLQGIVTGTIPSISVGTVTTLPAGSQATVTRTGTDNAPILNFGIPQGIQGIQGNPPTTMWGIARIQSGRFNNGSAQSADIDITIGATQGMQPLLSTDLSKTTIILTVDNQATTSAGSNGKFVGLGTVTNTNFIAKIRNRASQATNWQYLHWVIIERT